MVKKHSQTNHDTFTKYTVLGGNGFVGRRIVQMFKLSENYCYTPARGENDIFERELGNVFYCIGLTADYLDNPFETIEAHVSYLSKVLEHANYDKLVYLSSTRLYDSVAMDKADESKGLVLNPNDTRNLYDLSKALGENLCLTASSGKASVARLSCVYGDRKEDPGFLSGLLQRLRNEESFILDSSTENTRDYVHIDDVVVALNAILDSGRCEIFNVASGQNTKNRDISNVINRYDRNISFRSSTASQKLPICSPEKINSLGVKPVSVLKYLEGYMNRISS